MANTGFPDDVSTSLRIQPIRSLSPKMMLLFRSHIQYTTVVIDALLAVPYVKYFF
jgi:hypothetical protein